MLHFPMRFKEILQGPTFFSNFSNWERMNLLGGGNRPDAFRAQRRCRLPAENGIQQIDGADVRGRAVAAVG